MDMGNQKGTVTRPVNYARGEILLAKSTDLQWFAYILLCSERCQRANCFPLLQKETITIEINEIASLNLVG